MELIDCIDRIPKSLIDIVNSYYDTDLPFDNTKPKEIHIIGSGTSYNSAMTAKYFLLNNTKIKLNIYYPNVFINNYDLNQFDKDDLFIFVSQGGTTKLVIEILRLIKSKGFRTISISENRNSVIAKETDFFIDMKTYSEEFIYRTIGYSTTTLIICILGLKFNGNNDEVYKDDLLKAIKNLENIKIVTEEWFKKFGEEFSKSTSHIFIGNEILYPVCQEANIKFMEMIPKLCTFYELEESIHGPQNSFNEKMSFYILNNGKDIKKAESIYNFIKNEITDKVTFITNTECKEYSNIDSKSKYFYFLEYICFMQYLSYYFSKNNNRDLSSPIYKSLNNYIIKN